MENSKLAEALSKAATKFPTIAMDKSNPHFKSKYASLESIISAVTPILSENGLTISQTFEVTEHGNVIMTTTLLHSSGESIESKLPLMNDTKGRNAMQALGSSITYARRYALSAILGTSAGVKIEEDDDGNACNRRPEMVVPTKNKATPGTLIKACQLSDDLKTLVEQWVEQRPIKEHADSWSGILPLVAARIADMGASEDEYWMTFLSLAQTILGGRNEC